MKKLLTIFTFLLIFNFSYSQQWFPMGFIDTLGNSNSIRGILEIGYFNNKITIGGYFKKTGSIVFNSVAQWSFNNWEPMGIGIWWGDGGFVDSSGACQTFCSYHNYLYSGGTAEGAGGTIINSPSHLVSNIEKWNNTDWYPILLVVRCSNHIAKWTGTTWQQVGEGLNDTVFTLTVDSLNNKLYAGGGFTQTGLGI